MIQRVKHAYRYYKHNKRWYDRHASHKVAELHRLQREKILRAYPDPEPMPVIEWAREFGFHVWICVLSRYWRVVNCLKAVKLTVRKQ